MKEICQLGYGKGKITKLYFLRDLSKLAAWEEIQSMFDRKQLSKDEIKDLPDYYKT